MKVVRHTLKYLCAKFGDKMMSFELKTLRFNLVENEEGFELKELVRF